MKNLLHVAQTFTRSTNFTFLKMINQTSSGKYYSKNKKKSIGNFKMTRRYMFFWSTGTSTSFWYKKASTFLTRFELEISLVCLRHRITAASKSSFAGLKLQPAQSLYCFCVMSIGEIDTFLKYILISSLLSVTEGRKK